MLYLFLISISAFRTTTITRTGSLIKSFIIYQGLVYTYSFPLLYLSFGLLTHITVAIFTFLFYNSFHNIMVILFIESFLLNMLRYFSIIAFCFGCVLLIHIYGVNCIINCSPGLLRTVVFFLLIILYVIFYCF
jgi:hypothetical protein